MTAQTTQKTKVGRPVYDLEIPSKAYLEELKSSNYCLWNFNYAQFKKISDAINNYYIDYLLTGRGVILPNGMGKLVVKKNKRVARLVEGKVKMYASVNWQESKKQGKKIFYMNDETDGYTYGYVWLKTLAYLKYPGTRILTATRDAKHKLRDKILENKKNGIDSFSERNPYRGGK